MSNPALAVLLRMVGRGAVSEPAPKACVPHEITVARLPPGAMYRYMHGEPVSPVMIAFTMYRCADGGYDVIGPRDASDREYEIARASLARLQPSDRYG